MEFWDLVECQVEPLKPEILGTSKEGRAVLVNLPAGEEMGDHQVRERATVVVIFGRLEIATPQGESVNGGPGSMVVFEPSERHSVRALEDSRFLLLLAPWSLDEHSSVKRWSRDSD